MHAVYTILALAGVTLAQNALTDAIKMIPSCAIACLSEGSAASSCGIADVYCQCTKGAAAIKKVTQKCLCELAASGKCTPDELMKVNKASADICVAALAAKGETFSAAPAVDASACEGATAASSSSAPAGPVSSPVASSTPCPSELALKSSTMAAPISSAPSTMGPMPGMNMTTPPAPYGGSNTTTGNLTMTTSATGSPTITASELPTETGSATTTAPAQQTAGARATAAGDSFAVLLSLGMLGMAAAGLVAM